MIRQWITNGQEWYTVRNFNYNILYSNVLNTIYRIKQTRNQMKKSNQVHIRMDDETRMKWLELCQALNGSTQSKVFRNLVIKLYESLETATNIINYGR